MARNVHYTTTSETFFRVFKLSVPHDECIIDYIVIDYIMILQKHHVSLLTTLRFVSVQTYSSQMRM